MRVTYYFTKQYSKEWNICETQFEIIYITVKIRSENSFYRNSVNEVGSPSHHGVWCEGGVRDAFAISFEVILKSQIEIWDGPPYHAGGSNFIYR